MSLDHSMMYKALILVPSIVKDNSRGFVNIGDYLQAVLTAKILSSNQMVDEVKLITQDPLFEVLEMYFKNDTDTPNANPATNNQVYFQYRKRRFMFPLSKLKEDPILINSVSCGTSTQGSEFFIQQIIDLDTNENTKLLIFIYDHGNPTKVGNFNFNRVLKALDSKKLSKSFMFVDACNSGSLANYIQAIRVSRKIRIQNAGFFKLHTKLAAEAKKYEISDFPIFFNLLSRIDVSNFITVYEDLKLPPHAAAKILKITSQETIKDLEKAIDYESFRHLADDGNDYEIEKGVQKICKDPNSYGLIIAKKLATIGVTKVSQLCSFIELCKSYTDSSEREAYSLFKIIDYHRKLATDGIDVEKHIKDIVNECRKYNTIDRSAANYLEELNSLGSSKAISLLEKYTPSPNLKIAAVCSCQEKESSYFYNPVLVNHKRICLGSYAGEEYIAALQSCYANHNETCTQFKNIAKEMKNESECMKREFRLNQEVVWSCVGLSKSSRVIKFRGHQNKHKKHIPSSLLGMFKRFGFLECKASPLLCTADGKQIEGIDKSGSLMSICVMEPSDFKPVEGAVSGDSEKDISSEGNDYEEEYYEEEYYEEEEDKKNRVDPPQFLSKTSQREEKEMTTRSPQEGEKNPGLQFAKPSQSELEAIIDPLESDKLSSNKQENEGLNKNHLSVIHQDNPTPPKKDKEEHADQRIKYVECSTYEEYLEKISLWADGDESVSFREIPLPPARMRQKPPEKDNTNLGRSTVMFLYFYLNDELKNRGLPLFHPEDPEEYENDPNEDDYYDEFLKYTHHINGDFFFIPFFMKTDNKLATFLHIISARAGNPKLGEEIFLKAWERYEPLFNLIPWEFNSLN